MTAPKLTKAQRELLQQVKDAYANGRGDFCTGPGDEYNSAMLEEAGLIKSTVPCYVMITDAGRAALKDGVK